MITALRPETKAVVTASASSRPNKNPLLGPSRYPAVVNAPPDLRITNTKDSYHVGDTVDVYCQSSEPGVIASWSRPQGRFSDNVQASSGSLRIFNVRPDNAGVYRCEATGFRGTYNRDFNVDVIGAFGILGHPIPEHY